MGVRSRDEARELGKKIDGSPVYRRRLWKHLTRYFYLTMLLGLNVSTVMLLIGRISRHETVQIGTEMMMFAFLAVMDLWILPICLLEINSLQLTDSGLKVGTVYGIWQIPYEDVVSFKLNEQLVWATLRTKRGFYLINRKDLGNFNELPRRLAEKLDSDVFKLGGSSLN